MIKVNAHLHTPYSFSAFSSIEEALNMAVNEGISVVGINDFYTTEGYKEWNDGCKSRNLYPLFNIELIGLNIEDQKNGLRVNDPANPGRTYISGKGLKYPFVLHEPLADQLSSVLNESNAQVEAMYHKVNELLGDLKIGFSLDLEWIKSSLTKGMFRERHLAKALRIKVFEFYLNDEKKIKDCFSLLFNGKNLQSDISNYAGIENEIRANLLKSGGVAFVPETPAAFLPVETVCNIILAGGGIPTYPFLADHVKGGFISTRNDVQLLEKYAEYLYEQGFVITFGSEHNTPAMEPIELFARNGKPLTDRLMQINFDGACVIAAHQYLVSQGLNGYVDKEGKVDRTKREEFVKFGKELILKTIDHK